MFFPAEFCPELEADSVVQFSKVVVLKPVNERYRDFSPIIREGYGSRGAKFTFCSSRHTPRRCTCGAGKRSLSLLLYLP
jgi:hypothetical protein